MGDKAGSVSVPLLRDAHGRFTTADTSSAKVEGEGTADEYQQELERATALRAVQAKEEEEAAVMRIQYSDAEFSTVLTVAMMAKFTLTWGDKPLLCSGDAGALARLPDILVWLEASIPRARILAPVMFRIAAYVDWRIRGKMSDIRGSVF